MCIVQTFRHQSATVKAKPYGTNGVIQIDYFGLFTDDAVEHLVGKVLEEGARGRALVIRMDRAIMAFTKMSDKARARFAGCRVPGAVVCRPDQYDAISPICSELSSAGTVRLVFLDHLQALDWADHLASSQVRHESRQKHGRTHPIEELDRLLVVCQKDKPANQQMANRLASR